MEKLSIQEVLSDEHLKAIGSVIAEWAFLEKHLLYMLVEIVIEKQPESYDEYAPYLILATGMKYDTMLGLIRTYVCLRAKNAVEEYDKIYQKIRDIAVRRDTIAHASWRKGSNPELAYTTPMKSVRKLQSSPQQYTAEQITGIAREISSLHKSLKQFLLDHKLQKNPVTPLQVMPTSK